MIKVLLTIILLTGPGFVLVAQTQNAALTNHISFQKLVAATVIREVRWTNPNGEEEKLTIYEMAIPVDDKVKALTRNFTHNNYGLDSIWLQPRMIVFHSMDLGDLQNSLEHSSFLNDRIPESWGNLPKAGKLQNGAHFMIEKEGRIICLTPPQSRDGKRVSYDREDHKWLIRRHQDGNPKAIGIENVTDANGDFEDLTNAQLDANAKLARWLMWMEHDRIEYLTSHHQFNNDMEFEKMLETFSLHHLQKQYRTRERKDIGDKNLQKIIQSVKGVGHDVRSRFFKE